MKSVLFFLTLSIILSSCSFSKNKSYEYFELAQQKAPYDAIIVPGVPHDGISWPTMMRNRVHWSNYLYENEMTKNIIYSGGAVYTKYSEAKIMAAYGKALGIPSEHIFKDTNAQHSTENVYYSYLIAKEQGFEKIALATDPFQAKSLKGMIKKLEFPIDLIPILIDTTGNIKSAEPKISVSSAIEQPFVSIKERETFFTRLQGTMGKQIMWYEEDLPNQRKINKIRRQGRLIEE